MNGDRIVKQLHQVEEGSKKLPWEDITDVGKKLEDVAFYPFPAPDAPAVEALKKSGLKLVTSIDKLMSNNQTILLIWFLTTR